VDQILKDAGGEVTIVTYDASGTAADVNGNEAPTVVVTDSGGNAVPGFTPSRTSAGNYKATLPNDLETLDVYDVTWSWANGQGRRTQFEIVGGFLFTIAELRAFDANLTAAAYPAATVRDVRAAVQERFRINAGVSFVPRGRRAFLDGSGRSYLVLPDVEVQKVASIDVDGAALAVGALANVKVYPHGEIVWDGGTFAPGIRNVEVLYEHGMVSTPETIVRAALRYARHVLLTAPPNDAASENERATAVITDVGGYRLTIAGRDGPTGLPEVDAVLDQFGRAPGRVGGFA
jgi:hypothetical protein